MRLAATLLMLGTMGAGWTEALPLTNSDFAQVDASGAPDGWTLSTWYDCPVPRVSVTEDGGQRAVCFSFPQDAPVYTVSFHQTLPDLPERPTARIRFRYRATFAGARKLSVAISGAPGCNLPCNRVWYTATADGQWHDGEVAMPLRRVNRQGSVLEFTFNDAFAAGDRFYLAAVRMEVEPPPALTLGFTSPASGVLFTDAPWQALAGTVCTGPQARDLRARVSLFAEGRKRPLATRDLGVGEQSASWTFGMGARALGRYRVVATLTTRDGAVVAAQELTAWRLKPRPDTTRVVGGLVYHGDQPVVLLGTYHVCDNAVLAVNRENERLGLPPLDRDAMLAGVSAAGLDSAFFSWGIPSEDYLDAAARHGHRTIPECAGIGREWGGAPLEEQVAPYADDPRIFAWGGWDEPTETTLDRAVEVYRGLKSVSPHKLVVNTFHQPDVMDLLEGQAMTADLILVDVYDIRRPDSDLSRVGHAVAHAAAYARRHGDLAVGVTPQAFIYFGPEPTPAQLRAQIYLGMVNGATAFFPYAYVEDYGEQPFAGHGGNPDGMSGNPKRQRWWLPDSDLWREMPRLRRELDRLAPLILRREPLSVTAETGAVQYLVAQAEGQGYLVAVNPQATPNAATFAFASAVRRLRPLFGTPPATSRGTGVSLSLGPYEVQVYRVDLEPTTVRRSKMAQVMTVNGPMDPRVAGWALTHEHVLVDFIGADRIGPGRYDPDEVFAVMLPYLRALKAAGVGLLFECTPEYIGRDPALLRRLSEASGVALVTNTGWYKDPFLPAWAHSATAEEIAARWIGEARDGIGPEQIQPGFIKIAANEGDLSDIQRKITTAAGLTSRATGLTIASHTTQGRTALQQVDVLAELGVPASRLVWVHADAEPDLELHARMAQRGAWLSYDGIREGNAAERLALVRAALERWPEQLLISQDAGWYHVGEPGGGDVARLDWLPREFVPMLRQAGVSEASVQQLLIENPARAFGLREPLGP
ncbi:MAG: hypothetical protein HPY69_20535 [Armatimonadetes bacterium]|nr:hypothetical protein [Armatimonadota bacterium]